METAISRLTPTELEDLLMWLDQYSGPQPIDVRIQADADAGRLEKFMREAADDYQKGRTQPL